MTDDAGVRVTKRPRLDRGEAHTATHAPERQDSAGQAMVGNNGERNDGKQDGINISCQDDDTKKLGGSRRPIFCDLDGVLVDFDKGVRRVMGASPDQLKRSDMWRGLAKSKKFYAKLGWMPDGRELWDGIVDLHPTILTGLPMGNWAEPQKREWCKRELGGDVFVITCMSRDKHLYCQYDGSVLIDDRLSLKAHWESAGGVFIHHTSAECSLRELRALLESS